MQGRREVLAEHVGVDRGERRVELVAAQLVEQLVLRALDHVDRDARVARVEVGDARRPGRTGPVGYMPPSLQLAAQQPAELLELVVQAVDLVQHAVRVVEDQLALGGQLDRPAGAREHLDAELGLQPPDLLRDRRLREVQLLPAFVNEPWRATAAMVRRWRSSMSSIVGPGRSICRSHVRGSIDHARDESADLPGCGLRWTSPSSRSRTRCGPRCAPPTATSPSASCSRCA